MTAVVDAQMLGKRYRGRWALHACTMSIPAGHVVGLVGPNGAGKSTLLNLAVGLLAPTSGTVRVFGGPPASSRVRIGFVAQDAPAYTTLSVAEHLTLGAKLNPTWDSVYANGRVRRLGLDHRRRAGRLSGGQRAQLALTLALAKRPDLLVLDEPAASLDPLARRDFLDDLAEAVAAREMSVVLSSHLVSDLERICDYLIVLDGGRVQAAGRIADLLAARQAGTGLEDLVLAIMGRDRHAGTETTA
ncbi:ABC transporter ATP-binding protein [Dactylosporangium sucinum]|uniref:ABC transporter ATP-binding protein n=1 Tax=Dactylosporangium sucinum TaxID=1424081 RepID=A0A917WZD9_9ACTN|nr:ABC transporter ATP-binding protein [Dactylosporangium sucinum]GGM42688.1 ABC transporter ATP-binding protein [Dactylosporangium sucinum]